MLQLRFIFYGVTLLAAAGVAAYTYFASNSQKNQGYQYGTGRGSSSPPPPQPPPQVPVDRRRSSNSGSHGTRSSESSKRSKRNETESPKSHDSKKSRSPRKNFNRSDCSICCDDSGELMVTLECGHSFHLKCITKWTETDLFDQNQSCPNCRANLRRRKRE